MKTETVQRDIRETDGYREAETLFRALRRPGSGQISDAAELHASPDGKRAVFAGTIMDNLESAPTTRIALTDLTTGDTRVLTFGPNLDRMPKFSPDGRQIAFLSDRRKSGDFQLYILDAASGAAIQTPLVEGWVEYLHWSPDGKRILLGVAGHGADISGGQGAVTSKGAVKERLPSWMPTVQAGDESYRWRRAWIYDIANNTVSIIGAENNNVWEATWCGNDALAAVISPGPEEGLWYGAHLHIIQVATGDDRDIYTPEDQLGLPAASPSGNRLAIVEALCSDRSIVAGSLRLIEMKTGKITRVDTDEVDITCTEWRSDRHLLLAGHRGFETVVSLYDATTGTHKEVWSSRNITTGGRYAIVSGCNEMGECVLVGESFTQAPELAVIRQGEYRKVKSFGLCSSDEMEDVAAAERVAWNASDGLEIHGWLLRPVGNELHPVIMNVHGGPVWHSRPTWLGRDALVLMLLRRGYAVFFPNPRGSSGRGQKFAHHVYGDMGGADVGDLLSGLDLLVERGVADPSRLGVMGRSYGGFMTAWLICQDHRFSAAVAVAPITNQVTEQLISNIPQFVTSFLQDTYINPGGKYFQRSPVMHAHNVKTPTLNVCGALDRCTPPEEAVQFHNALLQNSAKSVLVTYPEEGHGVRSFPALIDYVARIVEWFEQFMPSTR